MRVPGGTTNWRQLGLMTVALLCACAVGPAAAADLDGLKRELWDGLQPGLLNWPIADPPLTFRGPMSLGASIYRERVGGVVAIAARDTVGAGSLVSALGEIVTNDHLLRNAHRANGEEWVLVWFKPDKHSRATREQFLLAKILSRDAQRDLALIRLAEAPPATATLVPVAASTPEIGEEVFTIGHPKNYLWSLTQGIVSQIRPEYTWVGADGRSRSATAIQTQAPASPGSSGGPLLDRRGAMVGVVFGSAPSAQGIYLAIEAHHVREMLERKGANSGLRP